MKTATELQKEKKQVIQQIERLNDASLINAIQSLLDFAAQKDEEYLGESVSSYNIHLEKADAEISSGKFVVHEDAIKKIGSWRKEKK
ncbi:MAG: hypothetical protein ACK5DD_12410 [Cyclobacteriaceae bacterium]|jgi:hypothetical protein